MKWKRFFTTILIGTLTTSSLLLAQEDSPSAGYIYPAGGQRGTTFDVILGGEYLAGATVAHLSGSGVEMEAIDYIRPLNQGAFKEIQNVVAELKRRKAAGEDWDTEDEARLQAMQTELASFDIRRTSIPSLAETVTLRVMVAPDAELGNREMRLQTELGLTSPLVFQVDQWEEYTEESARSMAVEDSNDRGRQQDDDPEDPGATPIFVETEPPTDITLPCIVNGQILPGDWDLYRFEALAGQRLIIDVRARRLIPFISDAVPGWFQATVTLYDAYGNEVAYNDDFRISPDPLLLYEIPTDGEYTLKINDAIYRGRESFVYRMTLGELPIVTDIFPLGGSAQTETVVELNGWNLPESEIQITTGEPGRFDLSSQLAEGWPRALTFAVDTQQEYFEENQPGIQDITLPSITNGTIGRPGDIDRYRFVGQAGDTIVAEIHARRLGSPLDAMLRLSTESGSQLAFNDDCEEDQGVMIFFREEGPVIHYADSRIMVTLPRDGAYILDIGDIQDKGGEAYTYRLHLETAQPDFELFMVPSTINARAGTTVPVTMHILRKQGFNQAITVSLVDPPKGFALSGGEIPAGVDKLRMTLTVPSHYPKTVTSLTFSGTAGNNREKLEHVVQPTDDVMQAFLNRHLVPAQEQKTTVYGDARDFHVEVLTTKRIAIPRGSTVAIPIRVTGSVRFGPVELALSEPPTGIVIDSVTSQLGGDEIVLYTDASLLDSGQAGNLIINAYAVKEGENDGRGKEQRKPTRVLVTTLPAIPYVVTEP